MPLGDTYSLKHESPEWTQIFHEEAPIEWRRMFEIARKICAALAAPHARGVVVGSLKDENIFLVNRPGEPEVVELRTLPIAEATGDASRPQVPVGEMKYARQMGRSYDFERMSPEQLMGNPVDERTDIFAIGLIAYEMLTGLHPFPDARGPAGVITAWLKQTPVPPSAARPSAKIPQVADEIVLRCLQREKTDRYSDVTALAQAIIAVLPGGRQTLRGMTAPAAPEGLLPFTELSATPGATMIAQVIDARTCGAVGCPALHQVLPGPANESVGSWIFFDHTGPIAMPPGQGHDVAPHPHIGLVSVRYMFGGQLIHRDSLGNEQSLGPGGVTWMSAGRGVVHSERSSPRERRRGARVHGLQLWLALPSAQENDPPAFFHHGADELPTVVIGGVRVRVILGEAFGARSPVASPPLLSLLDVRLPAGTKVPFAAVRNRATERAVYVVAGAVEIGGTTVEARRLAVLPYHGTVPVSASGGAPAHVVVVGSAPLVEPCHWWWTFIATSVERIEAAKRRWRDDAFGSIPGETERLPLPES